MSRLDPTSTWAARPAAVLAAAVGGVVVTAGALLLEPVGRLLVGGAGLVVLAVAGRLALLRPRLRAGPAGLVVRTLTGSATLDWTAVRIAIRETRRWGLRSALLELDTARGTDDVGVLVLLSRWDLGAEPTDVARLLETRRPT